MRTVLIILLTMLAGCDSALPPKVTTVVLPPPVFSWEAKAAYDSISLPQFR